MTRPAGARAHGPRPVTASAGRRPRGDLGGPGSATAARTPPGTTPRSRRTRWPGHTPTPGTSPATPAPSKSSSTATRPPPAPPRPANHGSTTTSATAGAPTRSSSSARTVWPALSATSTRRRTHPRPCCWKPRTTFSACSPPSPHRRRAGRRRTPQGGRSCESSPGCPPDLALAETMTPAPTGTSAIQSSPSKS